MSPRDQAKKPQLASDICRLANLGAPAQELLSKDLQPDPYLARLLERQLYADALKFTAYRLPKREAVWWGCLCLWERYRSLPAPQEREALQAVVEWVRNPNDKTRRASEAVANKAGLDTPAGGLALAVFLSGGSISGPGLPEVAPDSFLTHKLVAAAVLLASRVVQPEQSSASQRRFLGIADEVVAGKVPWTAPAFQGASRAGKHI